MVASRHSVRENMMLALDTLRTHKFRSFLTVLGVLIGTMTVIAVASIIAGLNARLVDTAEQFGTNTILVYKLQFGARFRLTREERWQIYGMLACRRHDFDRAARAERVTLDELEAAVDMRPQGGVTPGILARIRKAIARLATP